MGACLSFPIATILNESGTFTSNQTFASLDASNVRSVLFGYDVTALSGGSVTLKLSGVMPDGNVYELQGNSVGVSKGLFAVVTGPIPSTLQCDVVLNGATSVTLSVWAIGQA